MDGFVQSVAVYIVQLLPVILDAQDHMKQLVLMEELIRLLQENNQMLKYICAYLSSQGSIEEQDQKNYGTGTARQVEKRSKTVLCFDLSMNFIREYPSTVEAARDLCLSQSNIVNCCNGGYWRDNHTKFIKTNKVKQYIFKYKDEVN